MSTLKIDEISPSLAEVLHDVKLERDRQDKKWGSQVGLGLPVFNAILTEETGEAAKEVVEIFALAKKSTEQEIPTYVFIEAHERLYVELIQVAAVAAAFAEAVAIRKENLKHHEA